ncbi:MAG: hypothetical protein ACR2QK_23490 [Acidimicrobiales bacterium]
MNSSMLAVAGPGNIGGGVLAVSEVTVINFYLVYTITAISLVVFLARTLQRNGKVFLENAFDQPELAQSVNQLLVVGFYLLNLGYALLVYQVQPSYESLTLAFNELVVRIGILLLSLGVIHLLNMLVFWKIRTSRNQAKARGRLGDQLPPAAAFVPPPPVASKSTVSQEFSSPTGPGPVVEGFAR